MLRKRVAVAMSGGIDSSVTAALLKRQGYAVHGIFMRNWNEWNSGELRSGDCQAERDWRDVQRVASLLNIECHRVDFVKEYWTNVFSEVLAQYRLGHTPNPDERCNRNIKFGSLLQHVFEGSSSSSTLKQMRFRGADGWEETGPADLLATGHYARLSVTANDPPNNNRKLIRALDPERDQSYFLSTVPTHCFSRVIFPLGEYRKQQVREMARQFGLSFLLTKPESTGICFIGEKGHRFQHFLDDYLLDNSVGWVVNLDGLPGRGGYNNNNNALAAVEFINDCRQQNMTPTQLRERYGKQALLGTHTGLHRWTIGERLRLPGQSKRLFVCYKHLPTRTVFAVPSAHPALQSKSCSVQLLGGDLDYMDNASWTTLEGRAMYRYHRPLVDCSITRKRTDSENAKVVFNQPVIAQCPGQTIAFYQSPDDRVLMFGARVQSVQSMDPRLQAINDYCQDDEFAVNIQE